MAELVLAGSAFAISLASSWGLSRAGSRFTVLDYPGRRSLHDRPIPRTGGVAVLAGLAVAGAGTVFLRGAGDGLWALALGALLVALVSFWDDFAPLPAPVRLSAHFGAAGLLLAADFAAGAISLPGLGGLAFVGPMLGPAGLLFTLVFVVWFTNLYNFMDGMDGFAAGMSGIGFLLLALIGWRGGQPLFAALALSVSAANLGFLVLNFPPARIFLGDVGSVPMGFLAAGFSLWGVKAGLFELWLPVLIFSPFVVDATLTVLERILRGERFWEAHRSHYYQRLVLAGWGHRKTVLAEYLLMAGAGAAAVILAMAKNETLAAAALAAWALAYLIFALSVRRLGTHRETRR